MRGRVYKVKNFRTTHTDILILIDYFRGVEVTKDYTKLRDREVRP